MSDLPPCADRCTLVADILAARSVDHGRSERAERITWGLSPEFVPPMPRTSTAIDAPVVRRARRARLTCTRD